MTDNVKFPENTIFCVGYEPEFGIHFMCGLENTNHPNEGVFDDQHNQKLYKIIETLFSEYSDSLDIGIAESWHLLTLPEDADPEKIVLDVKNKLIFAGAKEVAPKNNPLVETEEKDESFKIRGNILTVDVPENMPQELKDFVQDVKQITSGCPFCGQAPHKDVIELGTPLSEIEKIKNEDEYKFDRDYRSIMNAFIKENAYHAEFRITCINEDCLHPTTGFVRSADEAEKKWNSRVV